MDHGDFANVSWQNNPGSSTPRRNTGSSTDGGESAGGSSRNGIRKAIGSGSRPDHGGDPLDLAGLGGGTLECTVNSPIKENDGTKDVFVSYLVTTHVCTFFLKVL
jgi:sorting nexin-4